MLKKLNNIFIMLIYILVNVTIRVILYPFILILKTRKILCYLKLFSATTQGCINKMIGFSPRVEFSGHEGAGTSIYIYAYKIDVFLKVSE